MTRILVVDDNTELLDLLRVLLEQRGDHQVTLSADGTDGLAKALADPPDLAILDVMMPDVSGYEICRQLRANPATATVPVIMLTARGQAVDHQAALDAGADDHMVKPVDTEQLLSRVNELLAARRGAEETSTPAHVVVLLSLRGGVGVTTLAVNLAATAAQEQNGPVCLVDLCPVSGHAALQLGLRPEPNWANMPGGPPTPDVVEEHLLQHSSGLRLLAAPMFPPLGEELPRQTVQTILEILQQQFATVVVDAPPVLSEAALAALEAATRVELVVTAEPPSIQTAIGTLRVLKHWTGKIQIVLNQVAPGALLSRQVIERTLKRPLAGTVPFDPNQARALTQGGPLVLSAPGSPLAQAVRALAREL